MFKYPQLFVVLFFCIFFSNSLFAQFPQRMTPTGIGGGSGFFSIQISPFNENHIYAVSDLSEVFVSKNKGKSWEIIPADKFIGIAQTGIHFTSSPDTLYAITSDCIAFKFFPVMSVDGGENWDTIHNPSIQRPEYLFADPTSTERIVISTKDSIFFSDDAGKSYNCIYNNTNINLYVAGVYWDDKDIFIAGNNGLIISSDNGKTFQPQQIEGLSDTNGFVSFLGTKKEGIRNFFGITRQKSTIFTGISPTAYQHGEPRYTSIEQNSLQMKLKKEVPLEGTPFFVATCRDCNGVVYAAGASNGNPAIFKSIDGGNTWTNTLLIQNNKNIWTGHSGSGGYKEWSWNESALGFAVNPNNPDHIIFSDYSFAHSSEDGGDTWEALYVKPEERNNIGEIPPKEKSYQSNGLENTSAWHLTFGKEGKMFLSLTDLTGSISEDGGHSWSFNYNLPRHYNTVYQTLIHPETGIWYAAVSTLHDIYQTTTIDDRINRESGAILYSIDEGRNWEILENFDMPVIWMSFDPNNSKTMYASVLGYNTPENQDVPSKDGGIYKTLNLQKNAESIWGKLGNPPRTEGHPYSITSLNDGSLVCSYSAREYPENTFTESAGVFVSADGGATWEDRSDEMMKYWVKDVVVDPHDPEQNTFYAGVWDGWKNITIRGNSGLYKTTDRGKTWTRLIDLFRVESVTVHPTIPDILYVTTECEGLWVTSNLNDSNPTFERIRKYPFIHPMRVFFNPNDPMDMWVTSFGNGLRRGRIEIDDPSTVSLIEEKERISISTFPNPASDYITVTLPPIINVNSESVEGKLFDIHGRLVYKIPFTNSTQTFKIKPDWMGTYILSITSQNRTISHQKIVIED